MPFASYIFLGAAFVGLFLLFKLATKPKPCDVCGTPTNDSYHDVARDMPLLCRDHLVSRWKQDMSVWKQKAVMIEPDFEKLPSAYMHGGPKDLKSWEYPPEAIGRVGEIIASIDGKDCANCGKQATIAFYKKEEFTWPEMEHLPFTPSSYLCTACAVSKVAPLIMSAQKPFTEGLYEPRDVEGIFHAQEW
ncbi:MAG: hypothetical protein EXS59_01945 [Candidatus Taylorbacteria bacterium]|nr:hypothetical protein [Candidatus Taylorbacteria bacterium]